MRIAIHGFKAEVVDVAVESRELALTRVLATTEEVAAWGEHMDMSDYEIHERFDNDQGQRFSIGAGWVSNLVHEARLCGIQRVELVSCSANLTVFSANSSSSGPGVFSWQSDLLKSGDVVSCARNAVTRVEGMDEKVSQLSAGSSHALFLGAQSRKVFSFGRGGSGQLGDGSRVNWRESAAAVDMPARHTEAVCVSAGHDFSAVVSCAGSVFTFGGGSYCRLGHGNDEDCLSPTLLQALEGVCPRWGVEWAGCSAADPEGVALVVCGKWHCVAATVQGELYSWGWNKFAQAGMSTPASTVPLIGEDSSRSGHREEVLCHPTLVQGLEGLEGRGYTDRGVDDDNDDEETTPFKVKKITAGSRHTAVLDEEGAVLVLGQVGLGGDLRPRLLCDGRTSKASDISSCLWTLGISYEQCGEKEKENGKKEEKEEDSRRKRAKIC